MSERDDIGVGTVVSAGEQEHDGRKFFGVLIEMPKPPTWPLMVVFDSLPVELHLSEQARAAIAKAKVAA